MLAAAMSCLGTRAGAMPHLKTIHDRNMALGMVKQSSNVTLVMLVYCM